MEDCVFCKIINGEIKGYKIFENEKVVVLLDINPISKGHCLIISKKHVGNIFDISEDDLKKIFVVAKKISISVKEKLNATGVNILHASGKDAQQSLFHFHMHLVPRYNEDGLDTWPKSDYKEEDFNFLVNKLSE